MIKSKTEGTDGKDRHQRIHSTWILDYPSQGEWMYSCELVHSIKKKNERYSDPDVLEEIWRKYVFLQAMLIHKNIHKEIDWQRLNRLRWEKKMSDNATSGA